MTKKQKKVLIRIIIAFLLLVVLHFVPVKGWLSLVLYLVPYFVIGYDILKKAFKGILNRQDRKSTRLNSSHMPKSRMPSSA